MVSPPIFPCVIFFKRVCWPGFGPAFFMAPARGFERQCPVASECAARYCDGVMR